MSGERDDVSDEAGDALPSPAMDLHRRALLATVAGGLALAASGLLLPDWLVEEAAADNHPVRHVQHRDSGERHG